MLIAAQAPEAAKDFAIASKDERIAREGERICVRSRWHSCRTDLQGFSGIMQVDGYAGYLTATINAIVYGHKQGHVHELLPWNSPPFERTNRQQ